MEGLEQATGMMLPTETPLPPTTTRTTETTPEINNNDENNSNCVDNKDLNCRVRQFAKVLKRKFAGKRDTKNWHEVAQ